MGSGRTPAVSRTFPIRYRVLDGWPSPGRGYDGTKRHGTTPYELWTAPSEVLDPALFSDTFDASPEGLALASHGRILHANPPFVSLFGYSTPSEVAGRPLTDFRMSPDSHDCVLQNSGDTARISNGNPLCDFLRWFPTARVESGCSTPRFGESKIRAADGCAMSASASGDAGRIHLKILFGARTRGEPQFAIGNGRGHHRAKTVGAAAS